MDIPPAFPSFVRTGFFRRGKSREVEIVLHIETARNVRQPGYKSMSGKKYPISKPAVSGESDPCTALASIEAPWTARMVPASAFRGSVAPIRSRLAWIAFSPFKDKDDRRPRGHERGQFMKKRTFAMDGVEPFGNCFGQMHHFHGNRIQPGSFIALNHVADHPFVHGIRFNDR